MEQFDRTVFNELSNEQIVEAQHRYAAHLTKHLTDQGDEEGLLVLQAFLNLLIELEIRMVDQDVIAQ